MPPQFFCKGLILMLPFMEKAGENPRKIFCIRRSKTVRRRRQGRGKEAQHKPLQAPGSFRAACMLPPLKERQWEK